VKTRGFTLIEVAILLVIVSVLVAIAVPNFRTAEIRSKVALVKGQLNVLTLALESYNIDNLDYPPTAFTDPPTLAVADDGGSNRTSYFTLKPLTTPIAYVTKIPEDPFADVSVTPSFDQGYDRYGHINAAYSYRSSKGSNRATFPAYQQYDQEWALSSVGPDRDYDSWGTGPENLMFYDPTNGVLSNGDIIRMQKGGMRE
jgi:prepilin-type N-terminal cleavage/methylation domain-containing protein